MSDRPWFRARTFGWGWRPATWEGWLVSGLIILLLVGGNVALVAWLAANRH